MTETQTPVPNQCTAANGSQRPQKNPVSGQYRELETYKNK